MSICNKPYCVHFHNRVANTCGDTYATPTILPDARTVRERFASGCPCTHCVHCVGFVRYTQTTSGCVRSGRERFASAWLCSVNARVDASDAWGRERRTVSPCLLTDLFISTDTIHMTQKGDICESVQICLDMSGRYRKNTTIMS